MSTGNAAPDPDNDEQRFGKDHAKSSHIARLDTINDRMSSDNAGDNKADDLDFTEDRERRSQVVLGFTAGFAFGLLLLLGLLLVALIPFTSTWLLLILAAVVAAAIGIARGQYVRRRRGFTPGVLLALGICALTFGMCVANLNFN